MHISQQRCLRSILSSCVAGALLLLAVITTGAAMEQAPSPEAEALLYDYFTALRTGDLNQLRNLLGGKLRAKRARLLQNDVYRHELVKFYGHADFAITGFDVHESGASVVTVEISLGGSERIHHQLTLERLAPNNTLKIVDMQDAP